MKKIVKFLIICAAVFAVGLLMVIGGLLAGGIHGIDKVAEHYKWFEGSSGAPVVMDYHDMDIKTIDVDGGVDVRIIGPEYYDEVNRKIEKAGYSSDAKAGDVFAIYGENTQPPVVTIEDKGKLKVRLSDDKSSPVVTMNFDSDYGEPVIYVCLGKNEMDEINVKSNESDIVIKDAAFKQANLNVEYGDINMEYVRSKGLNIKANGGDIVLEGEYSNDTIIKSDGGDVKFETSLDTDKY
ncbi:MAG: DUF4097 family beta strand repeat-containing protein, partial [Bacillota bacterium]|nr:DUF4097 family beta strand repeat-containing protein [Bacillota bacterium]